MRQIEARFLNGVKVAKSTRSEFWRWEHFGKYSGGAESYPEYNNL